MHNDHFNLQAYFSCNGEALSKSAEHSEQDSVDSGGRVLRVLSVQIDRTQVAVTARHCIVVLSRWRNTSVSSPASATPGQPWVRPAPGPPESPLDVRRGIQLREALKTLS